MAPLSSAQIAAFDRDGFLVVENLVSHEELDAYRMATEAVTNDVKKYPDVERQWVDHDGDQRVAHVFKQHLHHPDCLAQAKHPNVVSAIESLMQARARLYVTQVMLKSPQEAKHVFQPHQDCAFWKFMPPEVITCWFAFDDVTPPKGSLTVVPRSHKLGLLDHVEYHSAIEQQDGGKASLWRVSEEVMKGLEMVEAPVAAGGAVFFHGLTIHSSLGNTTDECRRAAGLIFMPAKHAHCLTETQLAMGDEIS